MTKFQIKHQRLEKAASALVEKMKAVHSHGDYQAMWSLAAAHGMNYSGPNYQAEFEALNNLLGNNDPKTNKPAVKRKPAGRG